MTSFPELTSIFVLAVIAGALLPFAVRPILHRNNMVNIPNERSSHTTPTYRGMGLATAAATLLAFLVATLLPPPCFSPWSWAGSKIFAA